MISSDYTLQSYENVVSKGHTDVVIINGYLLSGTTMAEEYFCEETSSTYQMVLANAVLPDAQ